MSQKLKNQALLLYLLLTGVFISLFILSNLIFLKFFQIDLADDYTLILSVGLIPYPLTFLVTDIISEIYGQKKANMVVKIGLVCAILVMGLTMVADYIPAMSGSAVNDETFHQVFGLTGVAVFASMLAYLLAQLIDIKLFHFWKIKTNGKKLWLRNNLSTLPSQLVDSVMVISLLSLFGALDWSSFFVTVSSLFLFKVLIALLDTPFFYLFSFLIKRHFNLQEMEELEL
ncbi:MAG: queuosine precursor transporter [Crocinitomicaceae bacterium]